MKSRHRRKHEAEVDAGALTDIMFFLLLFFLILSTMTTLNVIKLALPESSATSEPAKNYVTMSVNKDLKFFHEKNEIPEDSLYSVVEREVKANGNDLMVVRIEKGVPIDYLVKLLNVGIKQKLRVVLETEKTK